MIRAILLLTGCIAVRGSFGSGNNVNQIYNTEARIQADGYYSETYHVTTDDDYVLELNRIPFARNRNTSDTPENQRPVVFLMHGLQNSAVSYLIAGPETSVAYNLADAGFDVWLGNARGVKNSRNHLKLNPDDPKQKTVFFDFSFEEIALHDIPAMIDFVLETTDSKTLHYIGHSQGGTVFLVLTCMKPEYNEKFQSVHLLAGVGYQKNFPSRVLGVTAKQTDRIYDHSIRRGLVELFGPNFRITLQQECEEENIQESCYIMTVLNAVTNSFELLKVIAGASIKQFAHYGQNIRDSTFSRWNYGLIGNMVKYGRPRPPSYDLHLITADVTMHYTLGDALLDENDVLAMANTIRNAKVRKVARDTFSHLDFIVANDAKELVTDYIIEEIKSKNN